MQIRRSSYPADHSRPPCPFDHEPHPCLQRHGSYERFAGPKGVEKIRIERFYCRLTGRTLSVLPEHLLPYRSIHVLALEADFDRRSSGLDQIVRERAPPTSEVEKGCLQRAWRRFADQSRLQSLTGFFGQRIALTNTAEELWMAIRHTAGKLGSILLELARESKSLLGDYRCLSPAR